MVNRNLIPCKFFGYGYCRVGDACPFLHEKASGKSSPKVPASAVRGGTRAVPAPPPRLPPSSFGAGPSRPSQTFSSYPCAWDPRVSSTHHDSVELQVAQLSNLSISGGSRPVPWLQSTERIGQGIPRPLGGKGCLSSSGDQPEGYVVVDDDLGLAVESERAREASSMPYLRAATRGQRPMNQQQDKAEELQYDYFDQFVQDMEPSDDFLHQDGCDGDQRTGHGCDGGEYNGGEYDGGEYGGGDYGGEEYGGGEYGGEEYGGKEYGGEEYGGEEYGGEEYGGEEYGGEEYGGEEYNKPEQHYRSPYSYVEGAAGEGEGWNDHNYEEEEVRLDNSARACPAPERAAAECLICLEDICRLPDPRFGLLNCEHKFCLACIRKWRRESGESQQNEARTCPYCRIPTHFVIPSYTWPESALHKARQIASYKHTLSRIDCKHFKSGEGTCPFGNNCFYRHAYPNGSVEEHLSRRVGTADGGVEFINKPRLSQFEIKFDARRARGRGRGRS